jgi:hypothetical protein
MVQRECNDSAKQCNPPGQAVPCGRLRDGFLYNVASQFFSKTRSIRFLTFIWANVSNRCTGPELKTANRVRAADGCTGRGPYIHNHPRIALAGPLPSNPENPGKMSTFFLNSGFSGFFRVTYLPLVLRTPPSSHLRKIEGCESLFKVGKGSTNARPIEG